jgi:MoaA/NifB/PqqE/SkfB family radical SAM enzyme
MVGNSYLVLGYNCNNKCVHCFNSETIRRLNFSGKKLDKTFFELRETLAAMKKEGISSVVLTGGEATIRKDFFDLLRCAKEQDLKVVVQTNGRSFCVLDFARRVVKLVPDADFVVSLNHTDSVAFDSITCVKGSYLQTIEGIKNLRRFGAKITIKTVILKQNYRFLKSIVELSHSLGASSIGLTFAEAFGKSEGIWLKIVPQYSEVKPFLNDALRRAEELNMVATCYDVPFCFLEGHEDSVSEMEVYAIPHSQGEVIRRYSLKRDNIIEEIVLKRREKTKICKECKFFKVCLGVWGDYLNYYGGVEFKPIHYKDQNREGMIFSDIDKTCKGFSE